MNKDEIAKEEAEIRALEQLAKERWCKLKGHSWSLPQPNPLNSDSYKCELPCTRCSVIATLTIALPAPPVKK